MGLKVVEKIKDETERVNAIYDIFNEDTRLNRSKSARVEFLTTVKYIEKYLKQGDRILDIGAGAGEYSIYFANKGYDVTAVELADANIERFRRKLTKEMEIDLHQGNALDLSIFQDESFDVVFVFGPLYHLENDVDSKKCIEEAKRVCKKDGTILFAFISNDMVILTEIGYNEDFLKGDSYDHETFKVNNFPFIFYTVEESRMLLENNGISILKAIASDGVSELMEEKVNKMDEESYEQYLKYHYYTCEKPEMLGRSSHLLFVGKK